MIKVRTYRETVDKSGRFIGKFSLLIEVPFLSLTFSPFMFYISAQQVEVRWCCVHGACFYLQGKGMMTTYWLTGQDRDSLHEDCTSMQTSVESRVSIADSGIGSDHVPNGDVPHIASISKPTHRVSSEGDLSHLEEGVSATRRDGVVERHAFHSMQYLREYSDALYPVSEDLESATSDSSSENGTPSTGRKKRTSFFGLVRHTRHSND